MLTIMHWSFQINTNQYTSNKEKPLEIRWKELQTKFLYRIYNNDIFLDHTSIYWQNHYVNQIFKITW